LPYWSGKSMKDFINAKITPEEGWVSMLRGNTVYFVVEKNFL